jgi:hypothetical protein
MKKQVILDNEEFEKVTSMLSNLVILVDRYVYEENKKLSGNIHITDTDICDGIIKQAYLQLLYLDDNIKQDVIRKLPEDYFDMLAGENSVLADEEPLY